MESRYPVKRVSIPRYDRNFREIVYNFTPAALLHQPPAQYERKTSGKAKLQRRRIIRFRGDR